MYLIYPHVPVQAGERQTYICVHGTFITRHLKVDLLDDDKRPKGPTRSLDITV